jgi:hypothetical protein
MNELTMERNLICVSNVGKPLLFLVSFTDTKGFTLERLSEIQNMGRLHYQCPF